MKIFIIIRRYYGKDESDNNWINIFEIDKTFKYYEDACKRLLEIKKINLKIGINIVKLDGNILYISDNKYHEEYEILEKNVD